MTFNLHVHLNFSLLPCKVLFEFTLNLESTKMPSDIISNPFMLKELYDVIIRSSIKMVILKIKKKINNYEI